MQTLPELFREYARLERKRTTEGVTVAEHERWAALRSQLDRRFSKGAPAGVERRDSVRVPTRMKISYAGTQGLSEALMTDLSRSGVFINTAFPAPAGSRIDLRLRIESTGEVLEIPARVVSNNVGPGLSTRKMGMGVTFLAVAPEVRDKLDALYAEMGSRAGKDEGA